MHKREQRENCELSQAKILCFRSTAQRTVNVRQKEDSNLKSAGKKYHELLSMYTFIQFFISISLGGEGRAMALTRAKIGSVFSWSQWPSCFFTSTSVWTTAAKPIHFHSHQTCFTLKSTCIHWYTAWGWLYFISGSWNGSELSHVAQYGPPSNTMDCSTGSFLVSTWGFQISRVLVERKNLTYLEI